MNILKYTFILFVLVSIYSCGSSDPIIRKNKFVIGNFDYKMTDSSGNMLASGIMTVNYLKGQNLSGNYTITKNPDYSFDGSSTMNDGAFSGTYEDSASIVFFNMNPKMADANVFIYAKDYTDSLKGYWNYSTFRGNKTGGFYSAKRVKSKD
jgi:hypothetical protein